MEQHNNSSKTHESKIELTQSDLLLIQHYYIQKGLLFKKPQDQITFSHQWIQRLNRSFLKTLDIFFPLSGRLVMTQNDDVHSTKSFFIDCNNGAGASFDHVALDGVTVSDILDPIYIPNDVVYSFFPLNDVQNYQGVSKPLVAVKVTELVDGVFIGLSMNHSVADGTVFWLFFNTWSKISNDNENDVVLANTPHLVFDREQFSNGNVFPIRVPFNITNQVIIETPNLELKQRMFSFSKQSIAKLKAKANAEMTELPFPTTTKISSLQAVMAHLWVSITRNRNLKPEQEVSYSIVMGLRQRMEPPLAEGYFGNAVVFGRVETTAGKLVEKNGLGWAALQMNIMIGAYTTEKVNEYLKSWAESPKLATFTAEPGFGLRGFFNNIRKL